MSDLIITKCKHGVDLTLRHCEICRTASRIEELEEVIATFEKGRDRDGERIAELETEVERLQRAYRPPDLVEYNALKAENERVRDAIRHVRCEFEDGTWQARKLDAALAEDSDDKQ